MNRTATQAKVAPPAPIEAAVDARPADAVRRFSVEILDGRDLAGAGWPSIASGPEWHMHVYQSREFLDVWLATIGKARRVQCYFIIVKDCGGHPVLYLPLVVESRFHVRILRFADGGVADFNAPILASGQDLTRAEFLEVWREVLSRLPRLDAIDLEKICDNVGGARNPLTFLDCVAYRSSGHAICLQAMRETFHTCRSIAKVRKKLERQYQRLTELGPVELVVNPAADESGRIMRSLVEFKRKQYLRTRGHDFFATPGVGEFYQEMASHRHLGRISHLSALTCDGKVVSAHLGFTGRHRFYYVLPSFDRRYRSLSVGHLLLNRLVEECVSADYTTFDLGEGDSFYKDKWANLRLALSSWVQGNTTMGKLYLRLRRVRRFADHARAQVPQLAAASTMRAIET